MPKPTTHANAALPPPTTDSPAPPNAEGRAPVAAKGNAGDRDGVRRDVGGPQVSFRINEDGSVTFEHLPPELMGLVEALNPEAVVACELPSGGETGPDS